MNERIQELAEQAGYNGHYATEEFDVEKFAELIVRDLTDYIKDERGLRYLRYKLLKRYDLHNIEELKREFGVE